MRTQKFLVETDEDTLKKITAEMEDEYHHIILRIWVEDSQYSIVRIELEMPRHPEEHCLGCIKNVEKLMGLSLQHPQFRRRLLKTVGGERGCSHVLELLHEAQDYTRSIFWDKPPDKNGRYTISTLDQEGEVRCIAFRKK
ncbi:MAG: hypothetical protein H6Q47_217 [Deltaproteobacteria bacterium]|jgi:hypothetical protein|nr:hypothetical protein [Deltaproteobacteria bacterium]